MTATLKIATLLALAAALGALANDGWITAGGTVQLIEGGKTNVSMREEEIAITLRKEHFEVDVSFKFYNSGPRDETLTVGFPIKTSAGFSSVIEEVKSLPVKSYINGKMLSKGEYKVREEYERPEGEDTSTILSYRRWIVREVVFKSKSYTNSRVVYRMPYNESGWISADYIYGTGRSWNGPIGKMSVVVSHGDDIMVGPLIMHSDTGYYEAKPDAFVWEANGRYRYVFENVTPPSNYASMEIHVQSFAAPGNDDPNARKFQCWDGNLFWCNIDDYSVGWHWDRALLYKDPSDIRLFTKNQNHFFAMHGYDFKNAYYKNYFQNMKFLDNGKKYEVNPNFSEKNFNEFERKNVDFLLRMEKMIPK